MGRDDATYECVAENGVGDAVTKEATLGVFDGKWFKSKNENWIYINLFVILYEFIWLSDVEE